MSNVEKVASGCWIWSGGRGPKGYGYFLGRSAHRMSHEIFIGPVAKGMHVLHACDIPSCVNPEHLRSGPHEENMRDRILHRRARAVASLSSIESPMSIVAIARMVSQSDIAESLGVSRSQVSLLLSGKRRWTRAMLVVAQSAWGKILDMSATLSELHPDWTPDRVSAEVRVINAMALVPAEVAS